MHHLRCLSLVLFAACAACSSSFVSYDTPIPADDTFPEAAPEPEALERYKRAAAWSADQGGLALLILQDGAIVFEDYANDHAVDRPVHLFSGTKSFACPLALIAEAQAGLDLDAPTGLEEWDKDPQRRSITSRQLLQLTSGLDDDFWRLTWDGLRAEQRVKDKAAVAIDLPAVREPGARFSYSGTAFYIFAELIRRRTGRDALDLLQEHLLQPLGLRTAGWIRDPHGTALFPFGAWTTAREWARFGLLIAQDGRWRDQQLFPPGALARCMEGSSPMPAYGLAFWLNAPVTAEQRRGLPPAVADGDDGPLLSPDAPPDLVAAAGHKDQRLYISPSQRLVIVRLGEGDSDFEDAALLGLIFKGREP